MLDVRVPKAAESQDTYAYSLAEVRKMLAVLEEPVRTVVLTAALTGLRKEKFADCDGNLCNDCAADLEKRPNGNLYLIDSQGKNWSRGRELNSRPADYESAALPLSYLGFD